MPRPTKDRVVEFVPHFDIFKPAGVPMDQLEELTITVEELEALRLKDMEGLDQEICAERMQVSRPTFQRVLNNAHLLVAKALVEGKALRIKGGNYRVVERHYRCGKCGHQFAHTPVPGRHGHQLACPECGVDEVVRENRHCPRRRHRQQIGTEQGSDKATI